MNAIAYPRTYMTDGSARPLENGDIYIGVANQDPEMFPVQVYWDAALTVPASQPLEVSDGYVRNTGSHADFYIAEAAFSIRLRDKFGVQVDYIASVPNGLLGADGAGQIGFDEDNTYPAGSIGKYLQTFDTFDRSMQVVGPFALKTLGTYPNPPAPGVYMGAGGNSLSFQTLVSYPTGGVDTDNQRAALLLNSTTTDDGNSEEKTLCILTTIQTGYNTVWAVSTAYTLGANVRANGNIYRCTTAGTSAAAGAGPTGKGSGIVDGTARWLWINDGAIDAKLGFYNEVVVKPGAGTSWGMVTNFHLNADVQSRFLVAHEQDLTNNTGTDSSTTNGLDKINLWLACNGTNTSTCGLQISSSNPAKPALLWGAQFVGTKLASRSIIQVDASSAVGLGFGSSSGVVTPVFTDSVIKDGSTSPSGIRLEGTYASQAFAISGTTPAAIVISGTKSLASIFDTATSANALRLEGSYSTAAIQVQATTPCGIRLGGTFSQSFIVLANMPAAYASNAAAAAAGVPVGGLYRETGDAIKIRV